MAEYPTGRGTIEVEVNSFFLNGHQSSLTQGSALSVLAMILMAVMMSLLLWAMPGARRR